MELRWNKFPLNLNCDGKGVIWTPDHWTIHFYINSCFDDYTVLTNPALCRWVRSAPRFCSQKEVIRQYDSCNTGELDRHAQHQQPCLASRMLRVIVRQEQPVLSGTHWSSFAHRQMSVVLCLRRFPMKIENCHIRHQRPLKVHQRPPR